MKLNLERLAREPGAVLPFDCVLDLSREEWNGGRPFTHGVHVTGKVRNMAGALTLSAELSGLLSLVCDRCAQPFEREKTVEYETLLAFELANGESDDIVLLDKDGELDIFKALRQQRIQLIGSVAAQVAAYQIFNSRPLQIVGQIQLINALFGASCQVLIPASASSVKH